MLLLCFRGRCPASCKCCPAGPARWSRCIHFRGGLLLGNACFHTLGIKTLATKACLVGWLHVRNSNTNTLCAPSFYTIFSKIANYNSPPLVVLHIFNGCRSATSPPQLGDALAPVDALVRVQECHDLVPLIVCEEQVPVSVSGAADELPYFVAVV